jgi:TatD DNase family protein
MIDSHCHLDIREFNKNRDEIIQNALSSGVHTIINVGADLQTSINSVDLADKHDCIFATVGVHPHDARTYNDDVEKELCHLMENKKVKAIGEIGLDFYRDLSPRNIQKDIFRRQLRLAVLKKLPVVIHTREAFDETIEIVREYSSKLNGGVFHCFPGSAANAFEVIDLGFFISVGGVITYPKARMAKMATEIPLEHILIETDSPYLTPVPFRGKKNQPAYVRFVRDKLAELKDISVEEVETITDRNCQKLFRLVDIFEG